MKSRTQKLALHAIIAALTASLAPVPASSATPTMPGIENHAGNRMSSNLTFTLESGVVFLPLSEATQYLQGITGHLRQLLSEAITQWELKGGGAFFVRETIMRKKLEISISHSERILEGIRRVMKDDNLVATYPDEAKREIYRAELVKFGRAVASNMYTAADIISHIDQAKAPAATSHPSLPDAGQVKAMITAEHKKLGLSAPSWDQAHAL